MGLILSRTVFIDAPFNKPRPDHATWNVTWSLFWSKFNWTVYFLRAVFRCRFIACIQIQSFSGHFIFLHLSTLPRSDCPGSHGAKKHYLLFWARALKSFLIFLRFFYGVWARNVWRLNSQMLQDGPFFHYPIFVLKIPLFTFSSWNFFPLFVSFGILWQLATTHARDNKCHRDAKSSRQNGVTWCEFLQGKQIKLSPSRSLLPQKT